MTEQVSPDELASDRAAPTPDIEALKRAHRAQLDVMKAALDAAISTAQWQAVTNAELNHWQAHRVSFKNFHRLLCERFGYVHDEVDWDRDQLSLIEHIAEQIRKAQ